MCGYGGGYGGSEWVGGMIEGCELCGWVYGGMIEGCEYGIDA